MVESPRSPEWVQQMRQQWLADPHSVDASWRAYFEGDTVPTQLHRPQAPLPTQPTAVVSAEAALAAQADNPATEQPEVRHPLRASSRSPRSGERGVVALCSTPPRYADASLAFNEHGS